MKQKCINNTDKIVNDENAIDSKATSFEDAVKATGFGKFNILLMCIVVPCSFAQIAEQVAIAYVVPIAQCDLELSLQDKGILNSIGYIGMLSTGVIWGYICDNYGRRKIVTYGYLLNSLCHILSAFSQSFHILLVARFISGIMFTGPFSAITSYISEFHSSANRAKVQIVRGMTGALALVILPLTAWAILPTDKKFYITKDFVLHSWNIFFIVLSLPALISAIVFVFMPESPKFLMTKGKSTEALEVFQTIHKINSGKNGCYPVKHLMEEEQDNILMKAKDPTLAQQLLSGFLSLKPLFCPPYLLTLLHACINASVLIVGVFGLKLWYPQILQSINDNQQESFNEEIGICDIVESLSTVNISIATKCAVNLDNTSVYINSIILGGVNLAVFVAAGVAVNTLGKKTLQATCSLIAAICPIIIYFWSNSTVMLVLFPIILAFGELGGNVLLTVTLELFPTSFRITALNIHLTCVRTAIVLGNVIFPNLLMAGCTTLLGFISLCIFVSVVLTSLLPSTENKALE